QEEQACERFDRIYVCSRHDHVFFSARCRRGGISVLPNGVRLPDPVDGPSPEPFSLLFVGTLGYYPNEDAVLYLCGEIVPRLRRRARRPFTVRIVGTGASARLREAAERAGIAMDDAVPDMRPCYARSAAVVVPVRAGGGTRIKILEAWSYRRPVLTTS